jgi:hypothetical protein
MFDSVTYKLSFCGAAKFEYKKIWFYQTCSFTVNQTQFTIQTCISKKAKNLNNRKMKIINN